MGALSSNKSCQDKSAWLLGLIGYPCLLSYQPSYSPVLAFMVAGTLCCEFMTPDIPTPYSVPGTRSVGRCRNRHYSLCVSRVGRLKEEEQIILEPCSGLVFSPS